MANKERSFECSSVSKFSPTFDAEGIPLCLYWSVEEVAEWIEYLGFPQYKLCFSDNLINGRKLITLDASSMPRTGITDFEHIKIIAKKIRDLIGLEEPDWNRRIRLQHRERLGLFLEKKSRTGCEGDSLTFDQFQRNLDKLEEHRPFKRVAYPVIPKSKRNSIPKSVG